MSVFILQIDDFFIPNLEIRLYKLYDLKLQSNYYMSHPRHTEPKKTKSLKNLPEKPEKPEKKEKPEKPEEEPVEETEEPVEEPVEETTEETEEEPTEETEEEPVEEPTEETEEEPVEEPVEIQESSLEMPIDPIDDPNYQGYLKNYVVNNVKVTIPNRGKIQIDILDNLITWSEFVQIEITENDISKYSGKIQLSDIATYTNTIYITWNDVLAQYCWYAFAIYFEKYIMPSVPVTDWLSQYLTIDTAWSQYYKIDFDKIPEGIPIPTYDDLINIPVPDSIGLLNRQDTGNYYVTSVGGMTSSAILSSLLYTRKKIIDIGLGLKDIVNNLTTLKTGTIAVANGLSNVQSLVGTLNSSVSTLQSESTSNISSLQTMINSNTSDISSLQTSVTSNTNSINLLKSSNTTSTANITTLRNAINANSSDIASLQSSVNSLSSSIYLLQTTVSSHTTSINKNTSDIAALKTSVSNILDKLKLPLLG